MTKPNLRVVAETPLDINALNRADVGSPERWAKCHIVADRRSPIFLPDAVKRTWWR